MSLGRSARAVPGPTMIACDSARSRCASARASTLVIHCELPSAAAVRPSRLIAVLSSANARPVARWCRYGASESATASVPTPSSTSMPAARKRATPVPWTRGVWILHGDHHPGHARVDQRLGARWGVALVVAGLEGHVGGRAPGPVAGVEQGRRFGVQSTWKGAGGTATDELAVAHDDAADPGVRRGFEAGALGKIAGRRHQLLVRSCTHCTPPAMGVQPTTDRPRAEHAESSEALSHPDSHRRLENLTRSASGWLPEVRGLPS